MSGPTMLGTSLPGYVHGATPDTQNRVETPVERAISELTVSHPKRCVPVQRTSGRVTA